jgi:hypothetical protein
MGFLDNSGDIILDAVLTDLGRQKMARGNFRITKFAIGDDEIDYSLYDKNNASGSAYYDLSILQTPIMEAFTQENAGINYGLLTATATNILYLPVMEINKKGFASTVVPTTSLPGLYLIADSVNSTTTELESDGVGVTEYTVSGRESGPAILIEAGLNTTAIVGTPANRTTYLVNNNLVDNFVYVYYDNRFISSVMGPTPSAKFNNTAAGDGSMELSVAMMPGASISADLQLENYSAARIRAPQNGVVYDPNYSQADSTVSVISGPRSFYTMLNVTINPNLSAEYSKYGSANTQLPGGTSGSKLYDFLDTILYVQGAKTGVQVQVPIRIIKYKSG